MAFVYEKKDDKLLVNDPIYGQIIVPYPYSAIISTEEMQRLGKITQNGFSKLDFEKLTFNDRLSHSVGAFHVMRLILDAINKVLKPYNIKISQNDCEIALTSMLIHDIGHGPFSHALEIITNYSHEKRTTDILLGKTEINELLIKLFGYNKVLQIASFIAEINNKDEIGKDSFTKLLNSLVSHQIDADRLDYLLRDAYYSDIHSSINLNRIIASLNVVVNNNREYELVIDKKGLSGIENVLIQRYQMYRDVYLCPLAALGNFLFFEIMKRYQNNTKLHSLPLPDAFIKLATDPQVSNLADFLKMDDEEFNKAFAVLSQNTIDPLLAYISDFGHIPDYIMIEKDVSEEKIIALLSEIFSGADLSNTISIIKRGIKNKLYKSEQSLKIKSSTKISDLAECTNLIHPQELLEDTFLFFNSKILRLELGMTPEQFQPYKKEIDKMLADLNKKPEEFELKYILSREDPDLLDKVIAVFEQHGFKFVSIGKKENNDEYFDTEDFNLYQQGGSLRIRSTNQNNRTKYKGTYKMPTGQGEVYSSRTEIEESLSSATFEEFTRVMSQKDIPVQFDSIISLPVLNSTTNRTDIVLEKNGIQVCLSLDKTNYKNHCLGDIAVSDMMIEIEALKDVKDRIILNEIHDFLSKEIPGLELNKQSKYERGINRTWDLYTTLVGITPEFSKMLSLIKKE